MEEWGGCTALPGEPSQVWIAEPVAATALRGTTLALPPRSATLLVFR